MKELKKNEKSQVIATAKFIYKNYTEKRNRLEDKLATMADEFDLEGKIDEYRKKLEDKVNDYRKKLEEQYDKKTKTLREQIEDYTQKETGMTSVICNTMLDGHPLDEIVEVCYVTDDEGGRRLVGSFRYPDTIFPPEDNLGIVDEGPEFDGAGFSGTEHETEIDRMVAENEMKPIEVPEAHGYGSDFDADREADIDEDMPGNFEPLPEAADQTAVDVAEPIVEDNIDAPNPVEEFASDMEQGFMQAMEELTQPDEPEPAEDEFLTDPEEEENDEPWYDDEDNYGSDDDDDESADADNDDPFAMN